MLCMDVIRKLSSRVLLWISDIIFWESKNSNCVRYDFLEWDGMANLFNWDDSEPQLSQITKEKGKKITGEKNYFPSRELDQNFWQKVVTFNDAQKTWDIHYSALLYIYVILKESLRFESNKTFSKFACILPCFFAFVVRGH